MIAGSVGCDGGGGGCSGGGGDDFTCRSCPHEARQHQTHQSHPRSRVRISAATIHNAPPQSSKAASNWHVDNLSRPYKRDFHTHVGRDSNLDIRTPEDDIVVHFVARRNLGPILLSPLCSERPHCIQNINQSLSLAHFRRNLAPHPLPEPGQQC